MSLLKEFNKLDEAEKCNFLDYIADENIKYFVKVVNKHYKESRRNYFKKNYTENPEFRKKHLESNKKNYQKKKEEEENK